MMTLSLSKDSSRTHLPDPNKYHQFKKLEFYKNNRKQSVFSEGSDFGGEAKMIDGHKRAHSSLLTDTHNSKAAFKSSTVNRPGHLSVIGGYANKSTLSPDCTQSNLYPGTVLQK